MTQIREDDRGAGGRRPPGAPVVAALLASLLVAAVALPYDGRVFAFYYTPRVALFYPLVLALALVVSWAGRHDGRPALDAVDLALAAFVGWQLVAASLAPVGTLAWLGAYNRFGGAVYLSALALVLVLARRVLVSRAAVEVFTWVVAAVMVLAGGVALVQAAGATTPWRFDDVWVGRMAGTTGNPLNLAGLSLLGVWLGVVAGGVPRLRRPARWAAAVGAAFALAGLVVSVSRAAYLAVAVVLVMLAFVALVRRPRVLAIVAGVAVVLFAGTLLYDPKDTGSGALSSRISPNLEASTYGQRVEGLSRTRYWRIALRAVEERPLTGWGPGAYVVPYRRYVPAETLLPVPLSSVTDPHGLPFLLAAGSGLPGIALAVVVMALVVARAAPSLRRFLRRRKGAGEEEAPFRDGLVLAASAGAAALACFLLGSPADPSAAVPLVLMLGMVAGAPHGRSGSPSRPGGERGWRVARWAVFTATALALAIVVVLAARLYSADLALRRAVVDDDRSAALRAAHSLPQVPVYGLVAGAMTVRAATTGMQQPLFEQGERLLRSSLSADPSAPATRIELVRYYLSFKQIGRAMDEVRAGLEWSPDNPVLQGLWGYAARSAAASGRGAQAEELVQELQAYPDKSADGWYWLSVALRALSKKAQAKRALAEAERRAPELDPAAYEARLRGVL